MLMANSLTFSSFFRKVLSPANCRANIALDHDRAATLALEHLFELGHRQIAFVKGQVFSSDTEVRWEAIQSAAIRIGLPVRPGLGLNWSVILRRLS